MRFAVIIPACNEEACILAVLSELQSELPADRFILAVGVNGSSDRTAALARESGAIVGETHARGYGHGCRAAIAEVERVEPALAGYIFFAADGANAANDIPKLVAAYHRGSAFVLGCRTTSIENRRSMGMRYILANRFLAFVCRALSGRRFEDLGPLRLIDRDLFHAMALREWTYGWTIEAQIVAARMGIEHIEVPVLERRRIAGEQKVSRVSWWLTLKVGAAIIAAGFRARFRDLATWNPVTPPATPEVTIPEPVQQVR